MFRIISVFILGFLERGQVFLKEVYWAYSPYASTAWGPGELCPTVLPFLDFKNWKCLYV